MNLQGAFINILRDRRENPPKNRDFFENLGDARTMFGVLIDDTGNDET